MVAFVRFGQRHETKLSHTERMPPLTSALRGQGQLTGYPFRSKTSSGGPSKSLVPGQYFGSRFPGRSRVRRVLTCRIFRSGASRTRTGDLLGAIQALSQLSYSPAWVGYMLARRGPSMRAEGQ